MVGIDAALIIAQPTALYQWHITHCPKNRLATFAGYIMPLWFSSIPAEHSAVRKTAGLFDCTHMGVMEVAGRDAVKFLNIIATNEIGRLTDGAAQYSYILDEAGSVLDDSIVYRQGGERFMVVVNAANKAKIAAYVCEKSGDDTAIRFLDAADTGTYHPRLIYFSHCFFHGWYPEKFLAPYDLIYISTARHYDNRQPVHASGKGQIIGSLE
jgi:glycine cleavage system aminomethyltransferase T